MIAVKIGPRLRMEAVASPGYFACHGIALVRKDWCEPFNGYFLDCPGRRQPLPAFAVLVEALRQRARKA